MTTLYANPYNINATGFYFQTVDEFHQNMSRCVDPWGTPVEEFEISFIDGEDIDADLFQAWDVHQSNISTFFDAVETLNEHDKTALIALAECGYTINEDTPTDDVELHYCDSMRDLAMQFIDEGLFGEIPESIQHYIDYDAVARDLSMEYNELNVAGQSVIYRCP